MFTGIVSHCGVINNIAPTDNGLRLEVETHFDDILAGESIAVNGVCLTATQSARYLLTCDISPETLERTNLNTVSLGHRVNIERALSLNDRLGGHVVTGHIDGICQLAKITQLDEYTAYYFNGFDHASLAYLIEKGSIALNGVSLTINKVKGDGIDVMLIPHTLNLTNLNSLTVGCQVNYEYDYLARVWVRQFQLQQQNTSEVTRDV